MLVYPCRSVVSYHISPILESNDIVLFAGLSSSVRNNTSSNRRAPDAPLCIHTAISTVGYGEITPRSFLGRLITLPLLLFGLLLIALPSFVLGREFSVIWNDMTNADLPRTPFMQTELVRPSSRQSRSPCIPITGSHKTRSLRRVQGSLRTYVRASTLPKKSNYTLGRNRQQWTPHASMMKHIVILCSRKPCWRRSSRRCAPPWTRRALCCGGLWNGWRRKGANTG